MGVLVVPCAFQPRAWAAAALLAVAGVCHANPGYYMVTAYDNEGLRTVDLRYWTVKLQDQREFIWPELGFGYGVTSRWYTELLYSTLGPSNWDVVPDYLEWQNEVLLTQGEWPIDLALHATLSRKIGVGGGQYELEYGPVVQTEVGRTQLNANLLFQHSMESGDEAQPTQLTYQWQVRHHWHPLFDFGVQGFGELGRWDRWGDASHQSHRAGPAVFGHLDLGHGAGSREALIYQAAYLLGRVYNRQGHMFTLRVQYAF